MEKDTANWYVPLVLAIAGAAGVWYYWNFFSEHADEPKAVEMPTNDSGPAEAIDLGPLHPIPEIDHSAGSMSGLRELPDLANSDQYFKLELTDLFGEQIGKLLAGSGIIEKVVATVDNLPRKHVAERLRPVTALDGAFVVDQIGDDQYSISDESYRRFDPLVAIIARANVNDLTDLYRRFYPLFQSAYVDLGYPNAYFNDRLVEAIDDLLATPDLSGPVMLARPHVLYEFADPGIESRSSGQKLLLRMGSENAAIIKKKLRGLRAEITSAGMR